MKARPLHRICRWLARVLGAGFPVEMVGFELWLPDEEFWPWPVHERWETAWPTESTPAAVSTNEPLDAATTPITIGPPGDLAEDLAEAARRWLDAQEHRS